MKIRFPRTDEGILRRDERSIAGAGEDKGTENRVDFRRCVTIDFGDKDGSRFSDVAGRLRISTGVGLGVLLGYPLQYEIDLGQPGVVEAGYRIATGPGAHSIVAADR